jgi:hypothetical protein
MLAGYGYDPDGVLVKSFEKNDRLYFLLAEKHTLIFYTCKERIYGIPNILP